MAVVLAEAGIAGLVIVDVDRDGAEQVAGDVGARFDADAIAVATDVADGVQVQGMVDQCLERFGRVDILVNCAGIAPAVRWPEVTEANWRHVLDINLNGASSACWRYCRS